MEDRIYIAGPMRGIEKYNFPAFDAARDLMRLYGWEVLSPADADRQNGFVLEDLPEDQDWYEVPPGMNLTEIASRDIAVILSVDAIYMLKGWRNSKGATAEHAVAKWLGLKVIYENDRNTPTAEGSVSPPRERANWRPAVNLEGEMVTNAQGGRQSHVAARLDLIPPANLLLLGECLGFGAQKYGAENWKNISEGENLNHAMVHLAKWLGGDREEPHLVNTLARVNFALYHAITAGEQGTRYIHPDMMG